MSYEEFLRLGEELMKTVQGTATLIDDCDLTAETKAGVATVMMEAYRRVLSLCQRDPHWRAKA